MNMLTIAAQARALHKTFAIAAILGLLFSSLAYLAMPMSVSANEQLEGQNNFESVVSTSTGTIVVEKEVTDGSNPEGLFEFTGDLGNFSLWSNQSTSTDVGVGEYSVTEVVTDGWILEEAVCLYEDQSTSTPGNIVVVEGETVTCTFTNHEIPEDTGGEPTQCEFGENLLANGGFETPEVTHDADWDIFTDGTAGVEWVVEWFTDNFSGAAPDGDGELELHHGVNGWTPDEGAQYTELDSDTEGPDGGTSGEEASVMISQNVNTTAGATYELSWSFSPRPDTGADDNILEVLVDGVGVATNTAAGGGNTAWTSDSHTFEAGEDVTVAFRDAGDPNSEGTFLDDVALCLIDEPGGGGGEGGSISGMKWNDKNGDSEPAEGEDGLADWVIQLFEEGGEVAFATTTTDSDGDYSFTDLVDGDYTVCEVQQENWEQTYPATSTNNGCHDVTIDNDSSVNNDFGNQRITEEGGGDDSSTSSGGGGGERIELTERDPDPDDNEEEEEPEGEVLGEQTSVVPAGAPDTGAGGSTGGSALPLATLIAMAFAALGTLRATRSHV